MDDYDNFKENFRKWSQQNLSYPDSNDDSDNNSLSHSKLQQILDQEGDNRLDGRHILVIILSIIALITNATTLTAIFHIRRRLTANQTMMFSLCCADLLTAVGILSKIITEQFFNMNSVGYEDVGAAICVYKLVQAIIFTGHNSTLCNLLCLAVDHFCAIAKPLTYSVYMSKRRVHIILASCWIVSVLFGFSDFWIPAALHGYCLDMDLINYCERIYCSKYEPDHLMFCMVLVCLIVMSIMYGCIMCILYRYQCHEYTSITQRKVQRHIRGLITSFIILGLFTVLWLPNCIMDSYTILHMVSTGDLKVQRVHAKVYHYLYALVVLNAICDPIVYAMRMREIQESLKLLLCFERPTFSKKLTAFGDNIKQNSTVSAQVQRQFSNSTNMTVCSGGTLPTSTSLNSTVQERLAHRQGTIASQDSDINEEETPLNQQPSETQTEIY